MLLRQTDCARHLFVRSTSLLIELLPRKTDCWLNSTPRSEEDRLQTSTSYALLNPFEAFLVSNRSMLVLCLMRQLHSEMRVTHEN